MKIANPETGEIIEIRSSQELHDALQPHWGSNCKHLGFDVRIRLTSNGAPQARKQCRECGQAFGSALRLEGHKAAEPFDEEFLNAQQRSRENRRWQIANEFRTKHENRELKFQKSYDRYLLSEQWREKRRLVLIRANDLCEGCRMAPATEVHHMTYDHVFDEFLFELLALCENCHMRIHGDHNTAVSVDYEERDCRACRFQGGDEICPIYELPEGEALLRTDKCGPNREGFAPLK